MSEEILIFKLSALGDVVRTTSLIRPLLAKHPGARITWVTSAAARPLLAGNPLLHETLVWGAEAAGQLEGREFRLVLSMEEEPGIADLLPRLKTGDVVGVVSKGSGLAFTPSSAPYYAMSLLNRDSDGSLKTADGLKAANRRTYVEIWSAILGLPRLPPKELAPIVPFEEKDRAAAKALKDRLKTPVIGLNSSAGTRWPAKRLSAGRAAELARALNRAFGGPVLLLGGPDEKDRNAEIAALAGPAAVDAGTAHPLPAFAAIVDLCDAVVTADSLALHVANALGKGVVVFVGPTSAAELDLFGPGRRLEPPGGCKDFYKARCTQDISCVDRIPDSAFLDAAREALGRA